MSQEIEIEFKNLINEDEFNLLVSHFKITSDSFFRQHNDYFDTSDFKLKSQHTALRVREKKGFYQLTLKQPHTVGLLEIHQNLSAEEVKDFFLKRELAYGDVQNRLNELNIPVAHLQHLGRLTTDRAEIKHDTGLIVLDHSYYLDHEDFELEYEVSDYDPGKQAFETLLSQFHIPVRTTPNKIIRFYNLKKELTELDLDH